MFVCIPGDGDYEVCSCSRHVRSASAHEQLFLRAILSEFQRTGLAQLQALYGSEGQSVTCSS